jgi:pre-mRNA-processing factor 6
MASRRDFLSQQAPENYVAGLGRGATGFTTRSDLGPAREGPSEEQIKAAVAKRSAQLGLTEAKETDENDDGRYQDPDNEVGLFAGGIYDKDDEEADRIWKEVDDRMGKRRQKQRLVCTLSTHNPLYCWSSEILVPGGTAPHSSVHSIPPPRNQASGLSLKNTDEQIPTHFVSYREARETAEREEYERKNPKIQQQFADLKRALGTVTDEEWASLPDVKDMTGKTKRAREARHERHYAVPDSVLAAARDAGEFGTTIAEDGTNGKAEDGAMTNFAQIGAAQVKVLQGKLNQASQASGTSTSLGTSTSVDPKGYLTSLGKLNSLEQFNVGDVDRARRLLRSVVESNPTSPGAWIAAATLEELDGKIVAARNLIARGCESCPKNEDVWLKNIRLNDGKSAKVIAKEAVRRNLRSVRLWTAAMELELTLNDKRKVVRQALDHIPESEALWKEAVNLEDDPEDAKLLLAKATELIPNSIELWLALARLEKNPKQAKAVLNKARNAIRTSHEIWIAAARLQEQLGEGDKGNVIKSAVKALAKESAMPKREEWIVEAEKCEDEGAIITCGHIIRETLGWALDEDDDRKDTWMEDAKGSIAREKYHTARAIYAYALRIFVNSKTLWLAAVDLERNHGTKEDLWQVLEKAVEACPHSEVLWMMLAKERLVAGELDEARRVLGRAFHQNPNNEDIWLAAVKLEADNGQTDQARELLATARKNAPTDRVWMRSVAFERALGELNAALTLVQEALQLFPSAPKLWMLKGQVYEDLGDARLAREAYATGVKACPGSVPLWLLYSRHEERAGAVVKARSVLDRARQAVPKSPELWCELVRVERRAGNLPQARTLMAAAQKQMPRSGLLWAERIWHLEPRTQRKPLSVEALRQVDNDATLYVAVARIFWAERRLEKAQAWFEKALVLDPDVGDSWAWYYKFLLQHGTEEKRAEVAAKCALNDPRHGEAWAPVAKDPRNRRMGPEEVLKAVAATLVQG